MKLKTLCSVAVLCFMGSVFAMDSDSQKDPTLNSEKFGQSTSADQANLENLSREELLKVIADLQQQIKTHEKVRDELSQKNEDPQQQVKTHESVLAEALDQTIHTKEANAGTLPQASSSGTNQQQITEEPNSSSFEKLEDPKPIYNEALESARQELKSAQQDVKNFQKLYEKALGELKYVDSRAQRITKRYGEAECLKRGIPQDKAKAEQDVKNYLELLWDARDRKNKAHSRINKLTKELGISSQAKHNDIQSSTDNGKSPLVALYEFCRSKDTPYSLDDLKFDYVINKGKFNCILGIGGKKFSQDTFYESKKEAKNAIAKYALNVLKQKGFATDNKNPVVKLNEYLQDKKTKYNLSDVNYIDDTNNSDGTFNCIIEVRGKEYNLNLHCKSKKEAKNAIAEYVYNVLKKEEANAGTLPQASSSGLISNLRL